VKHKEACELYQHITNLKTYVDNEADLFNQWYENPETYGSGFVNDLATYAMTKQQFTNRKPNFVVLCEVVLNKNFLTFVPKEMPKVVYLSELPHHALKQLKPKFAQLPKNLKPHQFAHVIVVALTRTSPISFLALSERHERCQVLEARDYRRKPLEVIQKAFFDNSFLLSEKLAKSWLPLSQETFEKQLYYGFLDTSVKTFLIRFMMAVYRMQSRSIDRSKMESGHFSKFLVIMVELGNEIGEVRRVVSYSMMLRKDAMKVSTLKSHIEARMNAPTEPGVINFPIIFMTSFSFISPDSSSARKKVKIHPHGSVLMCLKLGVGPDTFSQTSEVDIDRDIESKWKKLFNLKIPFPACEKFNINNFEL